MTDACVVITTCGSEETALSIASALVDQHLAACVSIFPSVKSYYFFEGNTHLDEEISLMIKTRCELFDKVSELITKLHTYDVPEIIMFKVDAVSESFLRWLSQTTKRGSPCD
ncbi:MAG: divalent-cation tolerance protein CutA [Holophagales bacterium]|jgi:periplasmic divalent cation tolerance protein|nr:divalent-cation tolerance protein CutA [Holophagales bacterium]